MSKELEHLTDLATQKAKAVRNNDLIALDQILKQEQAIALTFRGLEQRQTSLLNETGLAEYPLSNVAENFPPKKRLEAKQVVERLQTKFQVYKSCAEVARNTLECNLHEIEKILSGLGESVQGPGYQASAVEPPKAMKTDFRA